jgi:hypothetical protein
MTAHVLPTLWEECESSQLVKAGGSPVTHLNGALVFLLEIPSQTFPMYSADKMSCST